MHMKAAAISTVEALAYQLRGGVETLRDPEAQRRLRELDETQVREIANRLTKWRWGKFGNGKKAPNVKRLPFAGEEGAVPPWEPANIETLFETWSRLHGNH
jgi:hypothetical protein